MIDDNRRTWEHVNADAVAALALATLRGRAWIGAVRVTKTGWRCACGVAGAAMWRKPPGKDWMGRDDEPAATRRQWLAAFARRHIGCAGGA